jgi:hypothetical protein
LVLNNNENINHLIAMRAAFEVSGTSLPWRKPPLQVELGSSSQKITVG